MRATSAAGDPAATPPTDVAARRPEVVGRLLGLGVSAYTLATLLPDWGEMIAAVQPLHTGDPT